MAEEGPAENGREMEGDESRYYRNIRDREIR